MTRSHFSFSRKENQPASRKPQSHGGGARRPHPVLQRRLRGEDEELRSAIRHQREPGGALSDLRPVLQDSPGVLKSLKSFEFMKLKIIP